MNEMSPEPNPGEENQSYKQPRHCTCLFTIPGTFDAHAEKGEEYMNRPPNIRDPFCEYKHVEEIPF